MKFENWYQVFEGIFLFITWHGATKLTATVLTRQDWGDVGGHLYLWHITDCLKSWTSLWPLVITDRADRNHHDTMLIRRTKTYVHSSWIHQIWEVWSVWEEPVGCPPLRVLFTPTDQRRNLTVESLDLRDDGGGKCRRLNADTQLQIIEEGEENLRLSSISLSRRSASDTITDFSLSSNKESRNTGVTP